MLRTADPGSGAGGVPADPLERPIEAPTVDPGSDPAPPEATAIATTISARTAIAPAISQDRGRLRFDDTDGIVFALAGRWFGGVWVRMESLQGIVRGSDASAKTCLGPGRRVNER
jgi:hypothetical protein